MGVSFLDWSYARLSDQRLVDARAMGYVGAERYLGDDARCITPRERDQIHGSGLKLGLVWETTPSRPLAGWAGGVVDADRANWYAHRDAPAAPPWVPIKYAVDFSPTPSELAVVGDYFAGILSRGGRPVGAYGSYPVIEYLAARFPGIACFWQTAGWSGFVKDLGEGTGGYYICTGESFTYRRRLSRHACMFQDLGARIEGTDHNAVLMEPIDWAWHPADADPASKPDQENDMAQLQIVWTKPDSQWARQHMAPNPDGTIGGAFSVLTTDQFVRMLSPVEITFLHQLADYLAGVYPGAPPAIVDKGQVDDAFLSLRTLLPRDGLAPDIDAIARSVTTAVVDHLRAGGVDLSISDDAVSAIATAVVNLERDRLAE